MADAPAVKFHKPQPLKITAVETRRCGAGFRDFCFVKISTTGFQPGTKKPIVGFDRSVAHHLSTLTERHSSLLLFLSTVEVFSIHYCQLFNLRNMDWVKKAHRLKPADSSPKHLPRTGGRNTSRNAILG